MGAAASGLQCDCDCSDRHTDRMMERDRGAVSAAPSPYTPQKYMSDTHLMQTPPSRLQQPGPIKVHSSTEKNARSLDFGYGRGGILKSKVDGEESDSGGLQKAKIKDQVSLPVQDLQRLEEEEAGMELGVGSTTWSPNTNVAREKALRVLAADGKIWICKYCKLVNKHATGRICTRCRHPIRTQKQTAEEREADLLEVLKESKASADGLSTLKHYVESPAGHGPREPPKNKGERVKPCS